MKKITIISDFQIYYPSKKSGIWNQIQAGIKRNFTTGEKFDLIPNPDPDMKNTNGILHVGMFIPLLVIPGEHYTTQD